MNQTLLKGASDDLISQVQVPRPTWIPIQTNEAGVGRVPLGGVRVLLSEEEKQMLSG